MSAKHRQAFLAPALLAAPVLHAIGLSRVLSCRGAIIVELLALTSLVIFVAMRTWCGNERRIARVCIFVSSLVLSLSAPAAFLPLALSRDELWAHVGDQTPAVGAGLHFALWALSLMIGGLAMHMLITRRWRNLPAAA